ncbi:signal peptidase complex subunit 2-like isoform X2 [Magnolia sinica]|uniref:signal peptidase complex subunit 2-like isoform X2 n=1 Tax=Magnolia sinica TaxID=86752 RepID=UPI002658280D|nr:signal peptidase complex subunit 2-like isoform X2 [Magnolia sinica]
MTSNGSSSSPKSNPKKANLMDPHSIKHLLDESVSEIVTGRGYTEDVRLSNIRLLVGTVIIAIALVAQFYRKKFPENKDFLIECIALYPSKPNSCTSLGEEIFFFSVFLQLYRLQRIVAVDHLQKGEECDPFHLSSSSLLVMGFWWKVCSGRMLAN